MNEITNPTSNSLPRPDARSEWFPLIPILDALTFLAVLLFPLSIHQDCAMYLECAQLLLDGRLPYTDFIDINPPLIMYLNVVPVLLSHVVPLHPIVVFDLLILALSIGSGVLFRRIIFRSGMKIERSTVDLICAAWSFFTLGMFVSGVFGQREHLFMIGFFPFFAARLARWNGASPPALVSVVAGIAASIGVCLKPHFALIVIAPEIAWLIASPSGFRRLFAAESFAGVGTAVAYAVHFLFLPESMREAFFGRWLPFISLHYDAYNEPWVRYMRHYLTHIPLALAAFPFLLQPARKSAAWTMARPLAAATFGAVISLIVQEKGWYYHRIPSLGLSILLLAVLVAHMNLIGFGPGPSDVDSTDEERSLFRLRVRPNRIYFAMTLAIVGLAFVLGRRVATGRLYPPVPDPIAGFIEEHADADDKIMWITTNPAPAFPTLLQLRRRPTGRYLWHFPISMFYSREVRIADGHYLYRTGAEQSEPEALFLAEMTEDVLDLKPDLILVNEECLTCPAGFRLADYLADVGFIDEAMGDYDLWGTAPKHVAWFRKADAGP